MSADNKATQGESAPLRPLLEKLPQELYDYIYDLTFTAQPCIRYASKPPKGASKQGRIARPLYIAPDNVGLLHVDRHSRDKFARSYYGGEGAVFVCDITGRLDGWSNSWFLSLNPMHRSLIKNLRCVFAKCKIGHREASHREECTNGPRHIGDEMRVEFGLGADATLQFGNEGDITDDLENFQAYAVFGVELAPIRNRIMCYGPRFRGRRF